MTELPSHITHGTPSAYNYYRCRCPVCQQWRRDYDNARARTRAERQLIEYDAARAYLWSKGLRFYGPGPFRRNPRTLAHLLANYLNDDYHLYVQDYIRRNT